MLLKASRLSARGTTHGHGFGDIGSWPWSTRILSISFVSCEVGAKDQLRTSEPESGATREDLRRHLKLTRTLKLPTDLARLCDPSDKSIS